MNSICKQLLILQFLTMIGAFVHAQSDYRPGFIITNEGDSIAGQIDYRATAKNLNSCLFKSNSGQVVEYFPDQLKGYGFVDDKNYTSEIEDGFFVEKLVEGSMSLYRMDQIYLVRKDSLYRLEYKKASIDELDRTVIPEDNRWRGDTYFSHQ